MRMQKNILWCGNYEKRFVVLLVDDVENREFLRGLLKAMYEELPAPKKKK